MKSICSLIYIIGVGAAMAVGLEAGAVMPGEVRWHNEASDTTRITRILVDAAKAGYKTDGELIAAIGREFRDVPYVAGTLEGAPEQLTVDLDEMDCTTFVETVMAMALTVKEGRTGWQDFIYTLGDLRYRQGRVDGYASRLHYVSDWIVDNTHRGNLREATGRMPGVAYEVKTLNFMSHHRDLYPALTDSLQYEKIKDCEIGYRSHRFPYVRAAALSGKWARENLKEGDVLAFTTKTAGLDVSHMGIVVMAGDGPHLLHASSKAGRVIEDPRPLSEYLRKNPSVTGARIIRPGER